MPKLYPATLNKQQVEAVAKSIESEAVVTLESGEHRRFALESLHRRPTFDETSDFVDH
ncbi:MAG: hypothetical protein ACXVA3_17810 [Vulcanimicrobiaceae bacterium]